MRSPGARVAVGGTLDAADRTIQPTMLTDVTPDMLIMQEEIFAPIVPSSHTATSMRSSVHRRPRQAAGAVHLQQFAPHRRQDPQRTSSGGVTINGFFSHYLENQFPLRREPEWHVALSRRVRLQGLLA